MTVRARRLVVGTMLGIVLFAAFLAILLLAGDLSSSKFIYVDF